MSHRRLRFAALLLVALAIVATPTVLILARATAGSAGFGDAETIGENQLSAATLDITVGQRTQPVRSDDLAPGDVVTGAVELVNAGTVALRYSVSISGSTSNGLGGWLEWAFVPAADGTTCPTAAAWRRSADDGAIVVSGERLAGGRVLALLGDATAGADPGDRVLEVEARELICLAAVLSIDAPNTVQATTAELSFRVDAEQFAPAANDLGSQERAR